MTAKIRFGASVADSAFGRAPTLVHHELVDEPLLTLSAIAELAAELPSTPYYVEHHLGDAGFVVAGGSGSAPRLALNAEDIVRSIETNNCRMALRHLEDVPRYRDLMDRLLDDLEPQVPRREGRMRQREAFLFVNAPGSVVPAHADPEHNFLLQVRGTKTFKAGWFHDRSQLDPELERQYRGGDSYFTNMPDEFTDFTLTPGTGVYVPPEQPHIVVNGDEASISFSITFRTRVTDRAVSVYRFNSRARRLGIAPRSPGGSVVRDIVKATTVRQWARVAKVVKMGRSH